MLIIKNCNLINMAEIFEEKRDILIENGKIVKIDKIIDVENYTEAKVIDANGKFVTPGFIEPHGHIGVKEAIFRHEGNDMDEASDPVLPQLRAIDAINPTDEAFETARELGVTTVVTGPGDANVIGGTFAAIKTYGDTVEEMIIEEEIAMKVALGVKPKENYGNKGKMPATRMAVAALLREALQNAKDYYTKWKKYEEKKEDDDEVKPPKFDMKLHSLMRVYDGMLVKFRALQADDIMTAVRIAEEFDLNYTVDRCIEAWRIPTQLKKHNTRCVVGPAFGGKRAYEVKNRDTKIGGILEKNDIDFAVSTISPERMMVHVILLHKKGLSREAALKSVTINAAKMVGLDAYLGSIEVGKDADIVIWDGDPLDYYTFTECVIIDGKVVFTKE